MQHDNGEWRFTGFCSPNFTSVPDEFFDEVAPRLKEGELRVLLYIIRRTFGFKKDADNISLSQMTNGIVRKDGTRLDKGTGLKKSAVCTALNGLKEKGIILQEKRLDIAHGAVASTYRLNIRSDVPPTRSTPVRPDGQGVGDPCPSGRTGGVRLRAQALSAQTDTQYTVNNKQLDKNVNVSKKGKEPTNHLRLLPDAQADDAHVALIADDILDALGDTQSAAFYRLVARKVPEAVIRTTLSTLKGSTVRSKAKVFTREMMRYAEHTVDEELDDRRTSLKEDRATLLKRLTYE